jgi:hypothetical protein
LICIHHVPADDPFPFSHAYFPRDAFDEVIERDLWVFGRKGGGYIGLYSQHPLRWLVDHYDEAQPTIEMRAENPTNVWIVELGNESSWNSFADFVEVVSGAPLAMAGLDVTYGSPSVGLLQFGWHSSLQLDGDEVELHNYPRFDNPYCHADFASRHYTIRYGDQTYSLDFDVHEGTHDD